MTLRVFHRTTIGEARSIVEDGWTDSDWDLGLQDARTGEDVTLTGVWLSSTPLGEKEGLGGDALLEVTLDVGEEDLQSCELEGFLWNARFWIASAEFLNTHSRTRIFNVDPRSSWGYKVVTDSEDTGDDLASDR